jgi:hypothetical protein
MNAHTDAQRKLVHILMAEWTCPNPEDIHRVEIPDELEPYEFWDEWKHDIEVIWPDEPDISTPLMEE